MFFAVVVDVTIVYFSEWQKISMISRDASYVQARGIETLQAQLSAGIKKTVLNKQLNYPRFCVGYTFLTQLLH